MDDARDPNDPNPGTPRPEAPDDRSAGLEAELAAALDDLRQVNDKLLRERADLENLKKRAARERAGRVRFGTEGLISDLLPVVDNLERAMRRGQRGRRRPVAGRGGRPRPEGLLDMLARHGVERVGGRRRAVRPGAHEAIAHVESAWHAPNARHRGASGRAIACTIACCGRRWSPSPRGVRPDNLANEEGGD